MDREYLQKYINILDELEKGNPIVDSEYEIKYHVENDLSISDLVKSLNSTDSYEVRSQMISDYFRKKEYEDKTEEEKMKEALGRQYGLDLVNIEHMKLQSGINIIAFYDNKINRKRLIEYNSAKSLVEEFTKIQNENTDFQTKDYKNNSEEIAKKEASNNAKRELEMVDINRARNEYFELITRISDNDPTKIQAINEIIKEADKRNIKYINFENMIALDEDGNIIESFYNTKTEQFELETPQKINTSVDSVDNKNEVESYSDYSVEAVDENLEEKNEDNKEVEPTEFEEKEELVSAEAFDNLEEGINLYHINCTKEQAIENIKRYSNDMNNLEENLTKNNITQEEYEFYKSYCERYINIKKQELDKAKTLEYTSNSRGTINMLIISLLAIVIGLILLLFSL